jgi:ankyrin repeat protein
MTPLHYAAVQGKLDVAQLLVQSGANIEAQDRVSDI